MQLGLTNLYVTNLCKKLTGSYFVGTFACDVLKQKIGKTLISKLKRNKEFALVINMSPKSHPGSHFVALTYLCKRLVLFDSLALPFNDPNIEAFVNSITQNSNIRYVKLKVPLQPLDSYKCGYYCIAFVLHQYKTKATLEDFIALFSEDKNKNDSFIIHYITKFISDM